MGARAVWWLMAAGAVWTAAVVAAPFLHSPALYAAAGVVCHQMGDRSFHFDAGPVAVCARCLGLYLGALAGLPAGDRFGAVRDGAGRLAAARGRALVGLAALPTAATLVAEWLSLLPVGNLARFGAALPLGFAAAFVVAGAIRAEHHGLTRSARSA